MKQDARKQEQIGSGGEIPRTTLPPRVLCSVKVAPRYSKPRRVTWLRPFLTILFLVLGLVGLAWVSLPSDQPTAVANRQGVVSQGTISANESCKTVIALIVDLPITKEGIVSATSQINTEAKRIEGFAANERSGLQDAFTLGNVYDKFSQVRLGLAAKVDAFVVRDQIETSSSSEPNEKTVGREFEIFYGPGKDLLVAVEQYDDACRQFLKKIAEGGEATQTSWGQ